MVDFENRGGVRHAITIGGNEGIASGTGTVGKKVFPLKPDGLLDQSAISVKLISVVENQLASTPLLAGTGGQFVVNVRTDLKLRGGPGVTFPVIRPLSNGTLLKVLEFQDMPDGRWALVDIEGDGVKDGFVFAKFIDPVVA